MVDAPDSKSGEGNFVRVRVSPALPIDLIMKKKPSLTSIFSLFATGITIVTNGNKKSEYFGCTINSFTSVSLDPAMFLFCLGNYNKYLKTFKLDSPLNLNFLSMSQKKLSINLLVMLIQGGSIQIILLQKIRFLFSKSL